MGSGCIKAQPPHVFSEEPGLDLQDSLDAVLLEEQVPEVLDFLDAVEKLNGVDAFNLFREASSTVRAHRGCALAAMSKWGIALHYAASELKADREVVLAAVAQNGEALYDAATDLKADRDVVLAAVTQSGKVLEYAADSLKQDPEVVMVASASHGDAKKYLDPSANYWSKRNMVLSVVTQKGAALELAVDFQDDKEVVLAAVTQSGKALKFAADHLQGEKDVVLAAVTQYGPSLKYAKEPLNQDPDCLKASGLWDKAPIKYLGDEEAALSVKFSLTEESTQYATDFALAMKQDIFLKHFKTYNPNAWKKKSCDPDFTNIQHACRGILKSRGATESCGLPDDQNLTADQKPGEKSCWRFAFLFHLEKCKSSNGFMIQVEEREGLGEGQEIETQMAKMVGLKVFRTYTNDKVVADHSGKYSYNGMKVISRAIQEWYESGCTNKDMENVFIGDENAATRLGGEYSYKKRPKHE